MSRISELKAKLAEVQAELDAAIKEEMSVAVARVREMVAEFGLTQSDVFGGQSARRQGPPVAAKYRDPDSGNTWSGRGKPPRWIAGKDRVAYEV